MRPTGDGRTGSRQYFSRPDHSTGQGRRRGRWRSEHFVDLKGAPVAAVNGTDRTLTVATDDRLLRVHLDTRKIDVLLANAFWGGLYPNSIVVGPSGAVYFGMRHGSRKSSGSIRSIGLSGSFRIPISINCRAAESNSSAGTRGRDCDANWSRRVDRGTITIVTLEHHCVMSRGRASGG